MYREHNITFPYQVQVSVGSSKLDIFATSVLECDMNSDYYFVNDTIFVMTKGVVSVSTNIIKMYSDESLEARSCRKIILYTTMYQFMYTNVPVCII